RRSGIDLCIFFGRILRVALCVTFGCILRIFFRRIGLFCRRHGGLPRRAGAALGERRGRRKNERKGREKSEARTDGAHGRGTSAFLGGNKTGKGHFRRMRVNVGGNRGPSKRVRWGKHAPPPLLFFALVCDRRVRHPRGSEQARAGISREECSPGGGAARAAR